MKELTSVFTDDMNRCFFTESNMVERHHIFGSSNRVNSEKYGFVIPLRPDYHPNGTQFNRENGDVDTMLKQMAQAYYESHYGTREQFRAEFGKSWL